MRNVMIHAVWYYIVAFSYTDAVIVFFSGQWSSDRKQKKMSNNSVPHASFGLDPQGRLVRIEAGTSNPSISRLSSLEETLRRLSSNFRQDDLHDFDRGMK